MESKPSSFIDQTVVPGDVVLDLSTMTNQTIKLGSGLHQDCDSVSVMKAGQLKFSKPNKYWVEKAPIKGRCYNLSLLWFPFDNLSDGFGEETRDLSWVGVGDKMFYSWK